MIRREPFTHIRRKQKRLITHNRSIPLGHQHILSQAANQNRLRHVHHAQLTPHISQQPVKGAKNVQINLEKATTSLRAQARLATPDFTSITEGTEIVVPVSVVDKSGTEVVHADITTWVTPAD
jgi:hypothetical protein